MGNGRLQLFRGAHETVQISCDADARGYWRMRVVARRSGEGWAEADVQDYELLSGDEMQDCLAAALEALLGRSD